MLRLLIGIFSWEGAHMTFETACPTWLCITGVAVGTLFGLFLLGGLLPETVRCFRNRGHQSRRITGDDALIGVSLGFIAVLSLAGAAFAGSLLVGPPVLTATVSEWRTVSYTPGGSVAAVVRQHCPATLAANELDAVISATRHREARRHPNPGRHVRYPLHSLSQYLVEVPASCIK
jgi:hypothetical protein